MKEGGIMKLFKLVLLYFIVISLSANSLFGGSQTQVHGIRAAFVDSGLQPAVSAIWPKIVILFRACSLTAFVIYTLALLFSHNWQGFRKRMFGLLVGVLLFTWMPVFIQIAYNAMPGIYFSTVNHK